MSYLDATLKTVGALSGNRCAFPNCLAPIYDTQHGRLVGELCHIKGRKGGPRFDPNQSEPDRNAPPNLMFCCSPHHTVIDGDEDTYTIEVLQEMKRQHEAKSSNTIFTEDQLEQLIRKVLESQTPVTPLPSLSLIVESHRTSADSQIGLDYYNFNIKLRNDGARTVRQYRIEVEIPTSFSTSRATYSAEVKTHSRGDIRLFRFTEQGHPGFALYPGDTSDYIILLDYSVTMDQYIQITSKEIIRVLLYSADDLLAVEEYPIAEFLNEERCEGWWARNEDRPPAVRHPRKYYKPRGTT